MRANFRVSIKVVYQPYKVILIGLFKDNDMYTPLIYMSPISWL